MRKNKSFKDYQGINSANYIDKTTSGSEDTDQQLESRKN